MKRLSKPQQQLLAEMRESSTGGLWINRQGRYGRTAAVLLRRGLVKATDWFRGDTFYEPVPEPPLSDS